MTEPGPDGKLRCPWGLSAPEYLAYHDEEWGRPVHGDQVIFERLSLEAFQSGLSWLTILRKRGNFRKAFAGFDPAAVAAFGPDDVQRLLSDQGIVRNRAKINAVITNARAALTLPAGLSDLVWSFADTSAAPPAPRTLADVPAQTPASKRLAAELRKNGFTFTGPVTAYATMQACGLVNDHLADCFARNERSLQGIASGHAGRRGMRKYRAWSTRIRTSQSFSRRSTRRKPLASCSARRTMCFPRSRSRLTRSCGDRT
jgi:DNA-3-methyladenine glycosylase I